MKAEEFVSVLFELQTNTHVAHLQTTSFSKHMALGSFYSGIEDLRDRFVETYQGKYGIIKGYKSFSIKEDMDPLNYLTSFAKLAEKYRLELKDGWLQQICDDIIELTYSTIYKLHYLN